MAVEGLLASGVNSLIRMKTGMGASGPVALASGGSVLSYASDSMAAWG